MKKNAFRNIPNIITIFRFILIPFIAVSISNDGYLDAFIYLTISGISDILDGFIARKFNFISDFGKLMDPLSDKATQLTVLSSLVAKSIIPSFILIILLLKEIAMIIGASFLYGKKLVVSSKWYGKLSTVLLYTAIISSLAIHNFNLTFNFDRYIYYLALVFTLFSFSMYFKTFFKDGYINKDILKSKSE